MDHELIGVKKNNSTNDVSVQRDQIISVLNVQSVYYHGVLYISLSLM